MKKMLVTAAEVKKCYQSGNQVLEVPPGTIITPAARDAGKEYGVQIITVDAAAQTALQAGSARQELRATAIDPEVMARIVSEVLSRLGSIASLAPAVVKETGPDGTVVARGDSAALLAAVPGVRQCRMLDSTETGGQAAIIVEVDRQARWQPAKAAVIFVIAGSGTIASTGRDIAVRAGDVAHMPPSAAVTTHGGLRLLAVWRQ